MLSSLCGYCFHLPTNPTQSDMAISAAYTAVLALLFAAWVVCIYRERSRLRGHLLPPGPKPWPIIGTLLDLTVGTKDMWSRFDDWADAFGTFKACS